MVWIRAWTEADWPSEGSCSKEHGRTLSGLEGEDWDSLWKAGCWHIHTETAKGSTKGWVLPFGKRRAPSNPRVTWDKLRDQTSWDRSCFLFRGWSSFSLACWVKAEGMGWKALGSLGKGQPGWKKEQLENFSQVLLRSALEPWGQWRVLLRAIWGMITERDCGRSGWSSMDESRGTISYGKK